jgi:hypothetical protein
VKTDSKTSSPAPPPSRFDSRQAILQLRVNEAAQALHNQGIRPTVTRIRTALGGGSPNDLAPALKQWRDVEFPKLSAAAGATPVSASPTKLPLQIADLSQELWQRALAAAVLEVKLGATSRDVAARTAEAQSLREQLSSVRDQLQRESLAYGELRAQAARHEAIAREALSREQASASRERSLIREVGTLRQRIAELQALTEQNRRPERTPVATRKTSKAGKVRRPDSSRLTRISPSRKTQSPTNRTNKIHSTRRHQKRRGVR